MKKFVCLALIALLPLGLCAQRKKAKKKAPTPEELAAQAHEEKLQLARLSTAQITFVDSVVISLDSLYSVLRQSAEENGLVSPEGFVSQLGNKRITTMRAADGRMRLFEQDLIGQEWTAPAQLQGLPDNDLQQQYPFMLSDGTTLYYAAENEEGLGGLDIYMTRYDAEEGHFLSPTNIGMPFNSEANDYLYMVDDFHQLGAFVTDRGQEPGIVCVYTFIPPAVRTTYNVDEVGEERLRALSAINSIRDTWTDRNAVAEAQKRIREMQEGQMQSRTKDFEFVVNDRLTYTSLSHFRDASVRQMAEQWLKNSKTLQDNRQRLADMRRRYADAAPAQKSRMATQLLALEADVEQAESNLHAQEKAIRKALLDK